MHGVRHLEAGILGRRGAAAGEMKFAPRRSLGTSFRITTRGDSDNIRCRPASTASTSNLNNSAAMTYELNAEDYGVPGRRRGPSEGRLVTSTDRRGHAPTGWHPMEAPAACLRLPGLRARRLRAQLRSSSSRTATRRSESAPTHRLAGRRRRHVHLRSARPFAKSH